jgi:hypothetical protein
MGQTGDLISHHEVRVLRVFKEHPQRWWTNHEVAEAAAVRYRTARGHTRQLTKLGVLEVQTMSPAHKFRLAPRPSEQGRAYLEEWEKVHATGAGGDGVADQGTRRADESNLGWASHG